MHPFFIGFYNRILPRFFALRPIFMLSDYPKNLRILWLFFCYFLCFYLVFSPSICRILPLLLQFLLPFLMLFCIQNTDKNSIFPCPLAPLLTPSRVNRIGGAPFFFGMQITIILLTNWASSDEESIRRTEGEIKHCRFLGILFGRIISKTLRYHSYIFAEMPL